MIKEKRRQIEGKETEGLLWYIEAMREMADEERGLTQSEAQTLFAVLDELQARDQLEL